MSGMVFNTLGFPYNRKYCFFSRFLLFNFLQDSQYLSSGKPTVRSITVWSLFNILTVQVKFKFVLKYRSHLRCAYTWFKSYKSTSPPFKLPSCQKKMSSSTNGWLAALPTIEIPIIRPTRVPDPSQNSGRIRRFFQRLVPRHRVAKAPTARPRSRPIEVSEGGTQTKRQPGVTFPAPGTPTIQIDISDVPEVLRSELGLPPHVSVLHIDPEDWGIVQRNFIAPLGHPFDPDDPDKPEEYAPRTHSLTGLCCCFSQAPQHPWPPPRADHQESPTDIKETTPPSYNWAAVSVLPQPTEITNWSAIFAAQREMSRLIEIQSYIETRIAEIKNQCMEKLKERVGGFPTWQFTYLNTRTLALLSPLVRLTGEDPGDGDLNRLSQEMTKVLFVRERLSPVSFLSFRGGADDGGDPWGWDWDIARLCEARRRLAETPLTGHGATVTQVYNHEATF